MEQIRNVLKIILDWNIRNGMQLNKKKSGIVIFATRRRQNIPNMKKANQVAQGKGKSKRRNLSWQKQQLKVYQYVRSINILEQS